MPHVLVWDIGTVPDISGFAASHVRKSAMTSDTCLGETDAIRA
jgi:hypothetical protein